MRTAYVDAHSDLPASFRSAMGWVDHDGPVTVVGPTTGAVEASPFLEQSGLRIGVATNKHSRFTARPRTGTVVAWCLHLDELLRVQGRGRLDGIVVVRALESHAAWVTAFGAEPLGTHPLHPVPDATPAIEAMVRTITMSAVLNQGLSDSRERSTAVQALRYLHERGYRLDPQQLLVEALRAGWPDDSSHDLANLANQINAGRKLRFANRLNPTAMAAWERASPRPLRATPATLYLDTGCTAADEVVTMDLSKAARLRAPSMCPVAVRHVGRLSATLPPRRPRLIPDAAPS